jgi:two-component system OmpR family sensor kinase
MLLRALRRKIDEHKTTEMVGAIEDQIVRLSTLVETLLDVSRIAEGRLALAPEPVDLSALVDRVVTRMTQVAADAGCPVTLEAPGPVHGVWDRVRTEQVITNLLSNAFKYGAGKQVDVLIAADDVAARVRVVDRGIGIPAHKQSVIFERYERAAPKNHYGGFGLGLWITRRTLEEMGGSIRVQSQEGAGALFEVELPRRPADDPGDRVRRASS